MRKLGKDAVCFHPSKLAAKAEGGYIVDQRTGPL
jgi:hypothetical protein